MTATPEPMRATDGRVPGRRGRETRRRLLDCTAELLGKTSWRDVKVIDIAREAGTSPATFYQYFADVEQAILVLAEELSDDAESLATLVRGTWKGDTAYDTARRIVEGFLDYWEEHRAVFRVVDLATEEGDLRFQQLRTRALNAIFRALTETIADAQRDGKLVPEIDPAAMAGVIVSMLAHVSSHRYGFEFWGVRTSAMVDSLTRILFWSVTGRTPPRRDPAPRRGGRAPS